MTLVDQDGVEQFRAWIRRQDRVAIDTETNITDLDHERFLVGMSFYIGGELPWYIPVGHEHPFLPVENVELWDWSRDLKPSAELIFHNAKFDLKILRKSGVDLLPFRIIDTMLWHHLLDSNGIKEGGTGHSLDRLERKILNKDLKKDYVKKIRKIKKDFGMEGVPPPAMAIYAENDVISTWDLAAIFEPQLEERGLLSLWWESDEKFMKLLVRLEEHGLKLDRQFARRQAEAATVRLREIEDHLPFSPTKPAEVATRFFSPPPIGLGYPVRLRNEPTKLFPNGQPATGESILAGINHPEAGLLLEYRGLAKAQSTWFQGLLDKADQDGYLHPDFRQHGTVTYRLSCASPNSQQFPREGPVKQMFLPEEGCDLIEFDYRAIEFRLAAVYGNVTSLLEIFARNGDPHQVVADTLGISRPVAKNTSFCILYTGGPERIAATAGIPLKVARQIYNDYRSTYSGIFEISSTCERLARERGYIKYWDGRRRVFRNSYEHRKAFNSIIQGGAFKIIQRSMLMLEQEGCRMVNQVHDSIWVNLPKGESPEQVCKIMEDWTEEQFKLRFHVEHKVLHA